MELSARLEADPGLGLLQTLPAIVRARSFYARMQQFANLCYGPIFGNGLAAWHGRSGNFWGHNAILRTAAFADSARLPLLDGKPPFGGAVLSHDFIEAALLRRAGWGVRLDTDLEGSYEEAPPSLSDVMVRDRRWCQGNLQHIKFLFAPGLAFTTRMHLLAGIMAYLSAPLWLGLVFVGLIIAVQAAITEPVYFPGPSLFPAWPIFDTARAIALFLVSTAIVLTPKALGWLSVMLNPRRLLRFGGPFALTTGVIVEVLMSALYAPVMMVAQSQIVCDILSGRDSGWATQRRGRGFVGLGEALRRHRWHISLGVALAIVAYFLNPDLLLWMLPVTAGLILAAFLSWISGSERLGRTLRTFAILRTPEEKRPGYGKILTTYEDKLAWYATPSDSTLSMLRSDRIFREWHLAQLPVNMTSHFDAPLILARAKAARASSIDALESWLTREELFAFLHDPNLVEALAPEVLPRAS